MKKKKVEKQGGLQDLVGAISKLKAIKAEDPGENLKFSEEIELAITRCLEQLYELNSQGVEKT